MPPTSPSPIATVQPVTAVSQSQPASQSLLPLSQSEQQSVPPSQTPSASRQFPFLWVFIAGATLVAGIVLAIIVTVFLGKKSDTAQNNSITLEPTITPWAYQSPTPTPLPKTIAPPGTPEWKLKNYRSARATIAEAQAVQKRIGATFGSIVISDENIFSQTEVYKGIPIKWTKGQPIPADRLAWIKAAIDTLPDFFIVEHPVTGFISVTDKELGLTSSPSLSGAVAYASGLNIFFTNRILKDSVLGAATKKDMVSTLFHEYVHVVQHYEVLQTFSEEYLSIPGNLIVVMKIVPFNKEFAKIAGWQFQNDEYGDSSYAILGTDAESQKTTDYGKTSYIEDLADSVASVIACDTAKISQARIAWIEKNFTKRPAVSFCPAKN